MGSTTQWSLLCAVMLVVTTVNGCRDVVEEPVKAVVHTDPALQWESDWDSAFARARAEQLSVIVCFVEEWCVWCRKLETEVLTQPEVTSRLADAALMVRLDVAGEARQYAQRYQVKRVPTLLVLSADEQELGRLEGFASARLVLDRLVPLVQRKPAPAGS